MNMKVYIDKDFRIHLSNKDDYREIETDFFDGRCKEYIEGYRYVPEGESWTRADGVVFTGLMISPWKPYGQLATAQTAYERGVAEADETIAELVSDIYNLDLEEIENV
jgi:hypothetical protein